MLYGKKIIGVCIPRIHTPSANTFIKTLSEAVRPYGYVIFAYTTCSDLYWNNPSETGEKTVFKLLNFDILDILVIMCENFNDSDMITSMIRQAKEKNVPVITFGQKHEDCITLEFDYHSGMKNMVRHVIEHHGCRQLHFMAGFKGNPFSEERIQAFKEVIAEYDIEFTEDMLSYGDFWSAPTIEATEKLIELGHIPQAIICANDAMALNVCNVMQKHGYRVPEDIIVTGFDGIDDGQITTPTITTCVCSYSSLANEIADLIIDGSVNSGSFVRRIMPPLELEQSCGCIRNVTTNLSAHLSKLNDRFYRYQADENSLFDMGAKIISATNLKEINHIMLGYNFYDMTCVLQRECVDSTINPMTTPETESDYRYLLFDTDVPPFSPYQFKYSKIFPNIKAHIDAGDPIIFSALNFLNIQLGYVSFHFHNYDLDNYYSIPQTVNMLNNAIGCFRNMRYQQYLNERMEELYAHDHLTGLLNRNALVNYFDTNAEKMRSGSADITFILCDLDRLKYINDTFGHDEGDFAISAVADALSLALPDSAVAARWGGDEMVAMFTGGFDESVMRSEIACFLSTVAESKPYDITASLGIITIKPNELGELDELTKASDKRMYEEKLRNHKNRKD